MIPYRVPRHRIRRDLICRETGRPVHRISAFGSNERMAQVIGRGPKSIRYNRLRQRTGYFSTARIVHTPRLSVEGWRQTRPTIIEEI